MRQITRVEELLKMKELINQELALIDAEFSQLKLDTPNWCDKLELEQITKTERVENEK